MMLLEPERQKHCNHGDRRPPTFYNERKLIDCHLKILPDRTRPFRPTSGFLLRPKCR